MGVASMRVCVRRVGRARRGISIRVLGCRVAILSAAVLLMSGAGCATRNDPRFNPYARGHGDGTFLDRCEQIIEIGAEALDSLDARLENMIW